MMKVNKWTLGLAAVGLVSLPVVVQAEEKPNQMLTALSSTTISGYVDTSAHWNPGTGNANPPGYAYNFPNKQDGFNLNVVDVTIEKPLDEGTWSAGYKVELWFGPNSAGLGNNSGSATSAFAGGGNDIAVKQAYVALRAPIGNGVDLKLGTWDTIIGYEVANSGGNPNYTRSWGYSIEPTQNTGLLASYQVNKIVGVSAGIANTWSPGLNNRSARAESSKTYMGALTLTAPDSFGFLAGSALYAGIVDGYNSSFGNDMTSYYLGGTLATPWKQLKLGAAWDYAVGHDNSFGPEGYAQAVAIYASFQPTDSKFSFHFRGEWFDVTDGSAGAGVPSEDIALTGTIQYDLWANVLSRLEVRWDTSVSGPRVFGGTSSGLKSPDTTVGSVVIPGNPHGASEKNAVLVAANIIYKF
jgi:hypothetical protein